MIIFSLFQKIFNSPIFICQSFVDQLPCLVGLKFKETNLHI